MNFLRSLISPDHWVNNAVPAGILVALFGALVAFLLGMIPSPREKLELYEQRREDGRVFVSEISEVRLQIEEFYDLPPFYSAEPFIALLMAYVDLRKSTSITLERTNLLSQGHSGERIVEAYDSAIESADDFFACLAAAIEDTLTYYNPRGRVFLRFPFVGSCPKVPESQKKRVLPIRDSHIKEIVAALKVCEAAISMAVEQFSRNVSEAGAVEACHTIPATDPFTFVPSLDLLKD